MSDRIKALTVILERDNRDDDVQRLVDAIMMFQGVAKVELQKVTIEDHLARERVRHELEQKLWKALAKEEPK